MATTQPRLSSLQQERSRATRKKLVAAAQRLWRTRGFDETTVSEVCEAAGVSKGTFYFYFPHKEDLLIELALSTSDRVLDETIHEEGRDLPLLDALRLTIDGVVGRVERTPRPLLARTIVEVYHHVGDWEQVRGERAGFGIIFARIFRRSQERGELPKDFLPEELGTILNVVIMNAMLAWARNLTGKASLGDVLWRWTLLVVNGAHAGMMEPRVSRSASRKVPRDGQAAASRGRRNAGQARSTSRRS